MAGGAVEPSISALGDIVAFEAGFTAGTRDQPMFRDRPAGFTGQSAPLLGENLTISDDGCVIAFSVVAGLYGDDRELHAYNRCNGGPMLLDAFTMWVDDPIPAPAVSQDGSVVAFARSRYEYGDTWDIHVFRNGKLETVIDAPAGRSTVTDVSISDDGTLVAFAAYSSSPSFLRDVYMYDTRSPGTTLLSRDSGGQPTGRGSSPSVSGDGSLIAFRHFLAVTIHDRTASVDRTLSGSGYAISLSRDGRHVAFVREEGCEDSRVYVARTTDRWVTHSEPEHISYLLPTITTNPCHDSNEPVISEHGRWVAWYTDDTELYVVDPAFGPSGPNQVLVRELRPAVTVDSLDFGPLSGTVTRAATVRNNGPAGWRVTSITASGGPFSVASENCPAVLHPGASCTVRVRYSPSGEGQQTGQLVVRDDSYPGVPLSASGRLVGVSDPDEPPPDPGPDPIPDPDPDPEPIAGFDVTPNPITFDQVIVGIAAPDRVATVSNTGQAAVTVQSVGLTGGAASDFSVVADRCTATTLGVGESCTVDLAFVPSDAGDRTATLTASGFPPGGGLLSATTRLQGVGRFDAVLTASPEVASGGQVVTVSGSGFPASSIVDVVLGGGPRVSVSTDPAGNFMQPWLVMTGTPQGELIADDIAVARRYDADSVSVIIVGTPVRPQATAVASRTGRRHVSR